MEIQPGRCLLKDQLYIKKLILKYMESDWSTNLGYLFLKGVNPLISNFILSIIMINQFDLVSLWPPNFMFSVTVTIQFNFISQWSLNFI